MSLRNTSKFISLILRHKPDAIGITLDEHGWANVDELIAGIAKQQHFDMAMLEEIVATDEKQRYSFNEDKTLIRANQGHSVPVDVELEHIPRVIPRPARPGGYRARKTQFLHWKAVHIRLNHPNRAVLCSSRTL